MKRFTLICEDLDLEQQTTLAAYFGEQHFGFWHRIPSCWLLNCPEDVTVMGLLNSLQDQLGLVPNFIIIEVQTWSSSMPPEWHEWFRKYWNGVTNQVPRLTKEDDAT